MDAEQQANETAQRCAKRVGAAIDHYIEYLGGGCDDTDIERIILQETGLVEKATKAEAYDTLHEIYSRLVDEACQLRAELAVLKDACERSDAIAAERLTELDKYRSHAHAMETVEAERDGLRAELARSRHLLGLTFQSDMPAVERLQKELQDTKRKLEHALTPYRESADKLLKCQHELSTTKSALEEARKDKERLDTAAKYVGSIDLCMKPIVSLLMSPDFICVGSNLRECLDKIGTQIHQAIQKEK